MKKLIDQIRDHRQIQKRPILKEMIKFSIVGAINTVLDFAVYVGLTRSTQFWQDNFLWANFISFLMAATSSYILNKNWTFRDKNKRIHIQYPKFILVSAIGLLLNETILYSLVRHLHIYDLLAKVVAVGAVMFWNFTINKFWTFKPEKTKITKGLSEHKI